MIGFLLGTACFVGFVTTAFAGRRGCGRGRGRRAMLRFLFERLDTSPSQERVIVGVIDEMRTMRPDLWAEAKSMREDIARAVAGPVFDNAALTDGLERPTRLYARWRETVTRGLQTIHETLDDRQREVLASWLRHGPGFGSRGCAGSCGPRPWSGHEPYRSPCV